MTKIRVFVAGHKGMVGSAIVRSLASEPGVELVLRSRAELDLTCQQSVLKFFAENSIDQVYLAAAKVGGIFANNTYSADFIYENLMIETNVIHACFKFEVSKLLFLGSSCIYPKAAAQPMSEEALLTSPLESTNEPYAIAKIAGIKLCESYNRQYGRDYRSVMPTNLYGPNDNFHAENSHVIPALMRRFHEAKLAGSKQVIIWGSGRPRREFLHVDDMAEACIYLMNIDKALHNSITQPMLSHVNVGTGVDCSIGELAQIMKEVVGFEGEIQFDTTKPDGTARKLMDVTRLRQLGWEAKTPLYQGLAETYHWFLNNLENLRT